MSRSLIALFATLASLAVVLAVAVAGAMGAIGGEDLGVAVAGAMGSGGALASHVGCGAVITTDTTLDTDLVDCPNNGIVIGADNITLDLNGHTIDGDGTEFADCPKNAFCDLGVVDSRHDGVTVKNGSVRQFAVGAFVGQARRNRLLGVSAARNGFFGIFFFRCDGCLLRNSAGNRTKGSGPDQVGMFLFQSHHDRIVHSTFRGNVPAGNGRGGGILSVESTNTVIRGNLMSRNGESGIIMESSHGFQITHNRLVRNHDGILLGPASHNVITRNHISRGGGGIRLENGHGNLIAHNVIAHTHHAGMDLGIFGGAHNVVRRNLVRDSRKDGFRVGKKSRHSVLKGNVAKRSGDDGFDVESRSAKLSNNRAVRNNDLGIEAVRGVIDGGGNRASGNGDRRQCVNVKCR